MASSYLKSVGLLVIIVASSFCSANAARVLAANGAEGLLGGLINGAGIFNIIRKAAGKVLGNKGLRWGYKAGNRILSIADKCEKVLGPLAEALCPMPTLTSPLPNSAVVNCIVEFIKLSRMNGTCLQTYESTQVPPEATCSLDEPDTLDSDYCKL